MSRVEMSPHLFPEASALGQRCQSISIVYLLVSSPSTFFFFESHHLERSAYLLAFFFSPYTISSNPSCASSTNVRIYLGVSFHCRNHHVSQMTFSFFSFLLCWNKMDRKSFST